MGKDAYHNRKLCRVDKSAQYRVTGGWYRSNTLPASVLCQLSVIIGTHWTANLELVRIECSDLAAYSCAKLPKVDSTGLQHLCPHDNISCSVNSAIIGTLNFIVTSQNPAFILLGQESKREN